MQKHGPRVKCSACKIITHVNCIGTLMERTKLTCKPTFRDVGIRQYREQTTTHHHWMHRRSEKGKCKHCGKVRSIRICIKPHFHINLKNTQYSFVWVNIWHQSWMWHRCPLKWQHGRLAFECLSVCGPLHRIIRKCPNATNFHGFLCMSSDRDLFKRTEFPAPIIYISK